MKGMIDETELARLEALAGKASEGPFVSDKNNQVFRGDGNPFAFAYAVGFPTCDIQPDNCAYIAAACNAVPALVAEVRRLRWNYECSEKSLQRHEHMVAELMEKVEAWEWWEEVRTYDIDASHPYREHKYANPYEDKKAKAYGNAYLEWAEMWHAAHDAVHADRK